MPLDTRVEKRMEEKMEEFNFKLTLENAPFDGDPRLEICRLMKKYADRLVSNRYSAQDLGEGARVVDVNGNRVGTMRLK